MVEHIVLYFFVALVVLGGLLAAFSRQVLYAIIGLGVTLLGLSGLFLFLGSPFVATRQLLIYIGGITVAIVFAMMLSVSMAINPPQSDRAKSALATLAAALFFAAVFVAMRGAEFSTPLEPVQAAAWSIEQIGHLLLNSYNVVFETLSVVLLLAIVGAILIARRERKTA
jgi:NADH:ubiquinone oxidoreductase subunit 6 (subunit J)